jgi:DNA-binding transcriptional MerR regulator
MNNQSVYRLEDLAEAFGLTERTARYYLGSLLPPRHKTGRGRRARYDQDTWNCFAFVQKAREQKFTHEQIANMLAAFSQRQVDHVVRGLDKLAVVPVAADDPVEVASSPCMAEEFAGDDTGVTPAGDISLAVERPSAEDGPPRWQVLYADEDLQITHKGLANPGQREQVRLAAALLKRILRG